MANSSQKRKANPLRKVAISKKQKIQVTNPLSKAKLSERIVDEIVKTPELVSKVKSVFRSEVDAARQALLEQESSDSNSDIESIPESESSRLSLSPSRSLTLSLDPVKKFSQMEVDLENGQIIEVQLEIFKLDGQTFDGVLSSIDL